MITGASGPALPASARRRMQLRNHQAETPGISPEPDVTLMHAMFAFHDKGVARPHEEWY